MFITKLGLDCTMNETYFDLFSRRLRRGLVERSLWVTVLLCFGIIAVLTAAVIYYKIEADHLRERQF